MLWLIEDGSIRFAPPLVISKEELDKGIEIIRVCLDDLDKIDEIPGDDGSEKDFIEVLDN